jgi:drug/metabolite transporter (DMT)-like permease
MDPTALVLVLSAAGFHAAWNLALHGAGDRVMSMAVASIVGGAVLAPSLLWETPWQVWPLLLPSIAAQVLYGLTLSAAYERGALSFAYPVGRGTAPLLVTLGGWWLLAEVPTIWGALGAVALVVGLSTLARGAVVADQLAAFGFAIATGCAIATYSVIDAGAVREVSPLGYLSVVQMGSGVVLAALLRFDARRLRASARTGAAIGLGQTLAYLLVLFAFQRAAAGSVSTLRELSVVIGILLSRERPGWQTWSGVGLCVVGASLAAV